MNKEHIDSKRTGRDLLVLAASFGLIAGLVEGLGVGKLLGV